MKNFSYSLLSGFLVAVLAWSALSAGTSPAFCAPSTPATHYFIAPDGDDDAPGTSPEKAWKTLARVSRSTFAPGDVVAFKRGGVWNESLQIKTKGTIESPIVFTAYGKGVQPVIDGDGVAVRERQGLVMLLGVENTTLSNLEVRNSSRDGIGAYNWQNLTIENCFAHHNMFCGASLYQGRNLSIRDCEWSENSLDIGKTGAYSGLRLNGTIEGALIIKNHVHHNIGGPRGWGDVANGIYLGQDNQPTMKGVLIAENNIHDNGNAAQNQAGRGINAALRGDLRIERNVLADQSASGVFVSTPVDGEASTVRVQHNLFLRNHLRAMGALGNVSVDFFHNVVYAASTLLPNHAYTGLAILDKTSRWNVKNNFFWLDSQNATWRGFIVLGDDVGRQADLDYNLYYSSGENKWMLYQTKIGKAGMHAPETYPPLSWQQWREKGYDAHSMFGKSPAFIAPERNNFHLQPNSPAIDAGVDLKLSSEADGKSARRGTAPDIGLYEHSAP